MIANHPIYGVIGYNVTLWEGHMIANHLISGHNYSYHIRGDRSPLKHMGRFALLNHNIYIASDPILISTLTMQLTCIGMGSQCFTQRMPITLSTLIYRLVLNMNGVLLYYSYWPMLLLLLLSILLCFMTHNILFIKPSSPADALKHHFTSLKGGGPRVVVTTTAFHTRVRGLVPGSGGLKETKNVSSPSTCESQYCGEPPWPRGGVLGLRPPGFEFRILCLEDSVISIISPSSGGSPGPV